MLDSSQNDTISPPKLSVTLPVTVCLQLYNTTGPGHLSWLILNNLTDKLHCDPVTSLYEALKFHGSPGWRGGTGNHKIAQTFQLIICTLTLVGSLYSDNAHRTHSSWLVHYLKFCSANHSTSMFLIGYIVWVSGMVGVTVAGTLRLYC